MEYHRWLQKERPIAGQASCFILRSLVWNCCHCLRPKRPGNTLKFCAIDLPHRSYLSLSLPWAFPITITAYVSNMPLETPVTEETVQTGSMILPHLPNEVLIKILSHLSLSRDLASAALVSRNFTALVQGILYRSIQLNLSCSKEEIRSYYSRDKKSRMFERFSHLINKLSANHELGYVDQQVFHAFHCQRSKETNPKS